MHEVGWNLCEKMSRVKHVNQKKKKKKKKPRKSHVMRLVEMY